MVKFIDSTGADEAAMRLDRDKHDIVFEDGEQAPALQAALPHLAWGNANGGTDLSLSYSDFMDVFGRALTLRPAADAYVFTDQQITAAPLTRCLAIMMPGLGLSAGTAAPAALALTRRQAHSKLAAHRETLTGAQLNQLEVDDSEWMDRLAPTSLTVAPWSSQGAWIRMLTWGKLYYAGGSTMHAAADLIYYAGDTVSDNAYDAGGKARELLGVLSEQVRLRVENSLVGDAVADEVATTLAETAPPPALMTYATPARRVVT